MYMSVGARGDLRILYSRSYRGLSPARCGFENQIQILCRSNKCSYQPSQLSSPAQPLRFLVKLAFYFMIR